MVPKPISSAHPLTPAQSEIAAAPPEAKMLVTAGAGTGKTHVLVARLRDLIQTHGLRPGQEILVLSFSRAAVREIRNRVTAAGGNVAFVRAYTFDYFATRLLSSFDPSGAWVQESFDGRIKMATTMINTNQEAQEYLKNYRHVMVDEIQDLVSVRAELVKALLLQVNGFTLFGDPAQGIYNYQLSGEERRIGSAALYAWIREQFAGALIERGLSRNFRALTDIAREAFRIAGARLNESNPDYKTIRYELDTLVMRLPSLGSVKVAEPVLRMKSGTTAVLCRTNGQALYISRLLREAGVPHRLQREATDRAVAAWIAIVLRSFKHRQVGRSQFLQRYGETDFGLWEAPGAEAAWELLKRVDRRRSDDLDVGLIAERIALGDVPDELTPIVAADIIISTIHRAKGLEFDRAAIVEPDESEEEGGDESVFAEETRVLYVALTRPRRDLYHLRQPNTWGFRRLKSLDERWVRRGRQDWQMIDFEVRGDDAYKPDPAGSFVIKGSRPAELQEYIRNVVKSGDRLTLSRVAISESGAQRMFYVMEHEGTPVGVTSEHFGGLLRSAQRIFWKNALFPKTIEDVFVDSVDTVAGTEAAGLRAELGPSGLWLRVRPYGLGRLRF
jgi:hypothetical protein